MKEKVRYLFSSLLSIIIQIGILYGCYIGNKGAKYLGFTFVTIFIVYAIIAFWGICIMIANNDYNLLREIFDKLTAMHIPIYSKLAGLLELLIACIFIYLGYIYIGVILIIVHSFTSLMKSMVYNKLKELNDNIIKEN